VIRGLDELAGGFAVEHDAVVVGSGPGGAVAAANLSAAGMRVAVLEAGPSIGPEEMRLDPPRFLARYFWEGGMRTIGGSNLYPAMAGRCLGGSSVVNSAILLPLPAWMRERWAAADGLESLRTEALDRAFERVFARLQVAPTPVSVLGRRNLVMQHAFERAGIPGAPLQRAVTGCEGCADCLTGCTGGHKQSVDRSYLPQAVADGAEVYTCAAARRVLLERGRAVGVTGDVVDPRTYRRLGTFTVRAPRVFVAAGALSTPALLLASGIRAGGTVGATLYAHINAAAAAVMDEVVEPWTGATQGWGALSPSVQGLKFESLWAPISLLGVRWGGIGEEFLRRLEDVRRLTIVVGVYAADVRGRVTAAWGGAPKAKLWVPQHEIDTLLAGFRPVVDALLGAGARSIYTGIAGVPEEIRSRADSEALVSGGIRPGGVPMTMNHIFGSCRMSADPSRGTVDEHGRVRGVEGLWLCDGSIFPGPSAANPQGTIMALSDLISRRVGGLAEA
jgi:choline dehydrogenase-like flavoprotein